MTRLCEKSGCRKLEGHKGKCNSWPSEAWTFLEAKDKNKLLKAGYATPRGGKKGGYQNHVYRNNKVIIPYEKQDLINLSDFEDGYVIRLYPDQAFERKGKLKKLFLSNGDEIKIGENAFVLYRSHEAHENFPPLPSWKVRWLEKRNGEIVDSRESGVVDKGDYILRLPSLSSGKKVKKEKVNEGPSQGIFAPEYASREVNFLAKVSLAWQIVHTASSPYTSTQAKHLRLILEDCNLDHDEHYNYFGMMRGDITTCPLCLRAISYPELHDHINLDNEDALLNSAAIVQGTNRSTIVNLFHLVPLEYGRLFHSHEYVAWGHATCNTKLGQRRCYSLEEVKGMDIKVARIVGDQYETFGWMSEDDKMIRSPLGAVWIRITEDFIAADD